MKLKYKSFKSSKEFEDWQTEDIKIHQVMPIALDIGVKAEGSEAEANISFGLFVVYFA